MYEVLREQAIRNMPATRIQSEPVLHQSTNPFENDDQPLHQHQLQHQIQEYSEIQELYSSEDLINEEIMKQRNLDIQNIERECLELNEIFKDLSLMVNEQGESIESIVENVEQSAICIEDGTKNLEEAEMHSTNATKKKLTLGGILGSIGTIAGGAILTAFHPFIGVPIIIVGVAGIGVSVGAGKII